MIWRRIFDTFLDLWFPPLCMHCKNPTTLSYLCETCWKESALFDLEGRCLHCFFEIEEPSGLCHRCSHKPLLPFPRAACFSREAPICHLIDLEESDKALSGLMFYQHARLGWKEPDLIAAIPPHKKRVTRQFAEITQVPYSNIFRTIPWPLYPRKWEVKEEFLEEEMTILLIDEGCTLQELQMASKSVTESFLQNVYILSLTF